MIEALKIPKAQPANKVPGYEMPEGEENLLEWAFVAERMAEAEYYWLGAVNQAGGPHVVPMWCIWFEDRIYFDGSPKTGWAKSLTQNPQIAVHLPDAEKVIIIYGHARIIYGHARIIEDDELTEQEWARLDSVYQTKYNVTEGSPYWFVEPSKVLAWNGRNLHTMTRWIFE